jgi:hypothetical protein
MAVAPRQGWSLPDMFGPGRAEWQVQKTLHPASFASTEKN